jgi:hypothetical protein
MLNTVSPVTIPTLKTRPSAPLRMRTASSFLLVLVAALQAGDARAQVTTQTSELRGSAARETVVRPAPEVDGIQIRTQMRGYNSAAPDVRRGEWALQRQLAVPYFGGQSRGLGSFSWSTSGGRRAVLLSPPAAETAQNGLVFPYIETSDWSALQASSAYRAQFPGGGRAFYGGGRTRGYYRFPVVGPNVRGLIGNIYVR